jgi:hypothetical protein
MSRRAAAAWPIGWLLEATPEIVTVALLCEPSVAPPVGDDRATEKVLLLEYGAELVLVMDTLIALDVESPLAQVKVPLARE